jgi:hypothetical protein
MLSQCIGNGGSRQNSPRPNVKKALFSLKKQKKKKREKMASGHGGELNSSQSRSGRQV